MLLDQAFENIVVGALAMTVRSRCRRARDSRIRANARDRRWTGLLDSAQSLSRPELPVLPEAPERSAKADLALLAGWGPAADRRFAGAPCRRRYLQPT